MGSAIPQVVQDEPCEAQKTRVDSRVSDENHLNNTPLRKQETIYRQVEVWQAKTSNDAKSCVFQRVMMGVIGR